MYNLLEVLPHFTGFSIVSVIDVLFVGVPEDDRLLINVSVNHIQPDFSEFNEVGFGFHTRQSRSTGITRFEEPFVVFDVALAVQEVDKIGRVTVAYKLRYVP